LQQEKILRGSGTLGLRALVIGLRNNECVPPSGMQLSEWQATAKWERKCFLELGKPGKCAWSSLEPEPPNFLLILPPIGQIMNQDPASDKEL